MTAYLNAAHHGWVFSSGCSKTALSAFLKPFGKPLKPSLQKIIKTLFKTLLTARCI